MILLFKRVRSSVQTAACADFRTAIHALSCGHLWVGGFAEVDGSPTHKKSDYSAGVRRAAETFIGKMKRLGKVD